MNTTRHNIWIFCALGVAAALWSGQTRAGVSTVGEPSCAEAVRLTACPALAEIPPHIRPIVGAAEMRLVQRLKLVHQLGETLNEEEINALCAFLKSPPSPAEANDLHFHALKNDILNVLRQQATPPPRFTDTLIAIYRNPAQDSVSRDYAVQHLVTCSEQGAADAPDAPEKIRAVLAEAARENTSIAGTALLGMHRLSARDAAFDSREIDQIALSHAQNAETDRATRITAIQVCSEREIAAVLPAVESLPHASDSVPLRLSAIAALGRLGGNAQAEQLQQLDTAQDDTFRVALRAALLRLELKERLY